MSKIIRLATLAFNQPVLLEPSYAKVFYSALSARIGADKLTDVDGETLESEEFQASVAGFTPRTNKAYVVKDGIAIIPITGTLTHRLGSIRPSSGMTGYDGIHHMLQKSIDDPDVKGIMLDIDSPGGQVAGCFDLADNIAKMRNIKPIWAFANEMNCSAAQLLASACSYRLVTQTSRVGSIGVMMAHTNIEKMLEQKGTEITLVHAGKHKVDANPYSALPDSVRERWQTEADALRLQFCQKVSEYSGLELQKVLDTEAAVFSGQAGVDAGLANELVNAQDAIALMVERISNPNINLQQEVTAMTDEIKSAPVAEAPKEETATVTVDAAAQERDRIKAILNHKEAEGRSTFANHLAFNTSMSVEEAGAMMAASAKEAVAVSVETTQKSDAFAAAMESEQHPNLTADNSNDEVEETTPEAEAAAIANLFSGK